MSCYCHSYNGPPELTSHNLPAPLQRLLKCHQIYFNNNVNTEQFVQDSIAKIAKIIEDSSHKAPTQESRQGTKTVEEPVQVRVQRMILWGVVIVALLGAISAIIVPLITIGLTYYFNNSLPTQQFHKTQIAVQATETQSAEETQALIIQRTQSVQSTEIADAQALDARAMETSNALAISRHASETASAEAVFASETASAQTALAIQVATVETATAQAIATANNQTEVAQASSTGSVEDINETETAIVQETLIWASVTAEAVTQSAITTEIASTQTQSAQNVQTSVAETQAIRETAVAEGQTETAYANQTAVARTQTAVEIETANAQETLIWASVTSLAETTIMDASATASAETESARQTTIANNQTLAAQFGATANAESEATQVAQTINAQIVSVVPSATPTASFTPRPTITLTLVPTIDIHADLFQSTSDGEFEFTGFILKEEYFVCYQLNSEQCQDTAGVFQTFSDFELPIVRISWTAAQNYCQFIGGDLPSSHEISIITGNFNPLDSVGLPDWSWVRDRQEMLVNVADVNILDVFSTSGQTSSIIGFICVRSNN